MKKILLLAMLLLAPAGLAMAGPIGLGVRAGADMANAVYSNTDPLAPPASDVVFGFIGGVFAEIKLSDSFSIEPEAEYVRKGHQFKENILVTSGGLSLPSTVVGTFTYTYDLLEIPLLIKAQTPFSPGFSGNLSAGPEIGIPLSANAQLSTSLGTLNQALNVTQLDWGVLVGAGLELDGFLLDLRYDRGLASGGSNSVLSLEMGYRIL